MPLAPLPTRTQTRGHCQCCANQQAVNGIVAKHGYTVTRGWFEGVCPGSNFRPMETDRTETDAICVSITAQCDAMEARVARLKAGTETPGLVQKPGSHSKAPFVEYATLDSYYQRRALEGVIWHLEYRVKTGRDTVVYLQRTADQVHGQALLEVEVTKKSGPTVHARGGSFGALCAASRMGASKAYHRTDDVNAVTCSRCRAEIERQAAK